MFKQAIAIISFHLLFFLSLADPAIAFCPLQTAITPPNFIPIISNNICAEPPGTAATDGCDDVCVLTTCCKEWKPSQNGKVTLPHGTTIDCSTVNCGNVCRLACDRQDASEACEADYNCTNLSADGEAYVFSRNGGCDPFKILTFHSPIPDPTSPTHVGFGFKVAEGIYVFGSVENGAGCAYVPAGNAFVIPGNDNGFWMATGSKDQMLTTFQYPPASKFHGTISPIHVANYTQYKTSKVEKPNVCAAVKAAEDLYYTGYALVFNNCLNAVYNVLSAYGVTFAPSVTPLNYWCPSGNSASSFFAALWDDWLPPINNWSDAEDLQAHGSPVVASQTCPSYVPPSCGGATLPPSTGSCGGADFTNCPPCGSLGPTCFVGAVALADCQTSCAAVNPCVCKGACNQGETCYSWSRS